MAKLTLIKGNCIDVLPTIAKESIDILLTDPPYNVGLGYPTYNDRRPEQEFWTIMAQWLTQAYRVLKADGQAYIKFSTDFWRFFPIAHKIGFKYENTLIWDKKYFYPKRRFRSWGYAYEPILVFGKEKRRKLWKPALNIIRAKPCYHDRNDSNKRHFIAQMPLEIPYTIISKATKSNDTVLDCFLGSGTTLLACKLLGRNGIGIELDSSTIEIAKKRLNWDVPTIEWQFFEVKPNQTQPPAHAHEQLQPSQNTNERRCPKCNSALILATSLMGTSELVCQACGFWIAKSIRSIDWV